MALVLRLVPARNHHVSGVLLPSASKRTPFAARIVKAIIRMNQACKLELDGWTACTSNPRGALERRVALYNVQSLLP